MSGRCGLGGRSGRQRLARCHGSGVRDSGAGGACRCGPRRGLRGRRDCGCKSCGGHRRWRGNGCGGTQALQGRPVRGWRPLQGTGRQGRWRPPGKCRPEGTCRRRAEEGDGEALDGSDPGWGALGTRGVDWPSKGAAGTASAGGAKPWVPCEPAAGTVGAAAATGAGAPGAKAPPSPMAAAGPAEVGALAISGGAVAVVAGTVTGLGGGAATGTAPDATAAWRDGSGWNGPERHNPERHGLSLHSRRQDGSGSALPIAGRPIAACRSIRRRIRRGSQARAMGERRRRQGGLRQGRDADRIGLLRGRRVGAGPEHAACARWLGGCRAARHFGARGRVARSIGRSGRPGISPAGCLRQHALIDSGESRIETGSGAAGRKADALIGGRKVRHEAGQGRHGALPWSSLSVSATAVWARSMASEAA